MLTIYVYPNEAYLESKEEFVSLKKKQVLHLEHSLASIQLWESKWHKPFLGGKEEKSYEEIIDYIRCMTLNKEEVDEKAYLFIGDENLKTITSYLTDPMTATTFTDFEKKNDPLNKRAVTSELIYYYMIALNIPSEYRFWHISQLITLIRVINVKNTPKKKRSRRDILAQYDRLNEERKKKFNTRG